MNPKQRTLVIVLGAALLAFLVFRPFVIVPAGARGVVFTLTSGVLEKQLGEGFHVLVPVVQQALLYDVRTQTYSMSRVHWDGEVRGDDSLTALTADGQTVNVDISVRFHPDPENVWRLHREVGADYVNKILRPEIRSQTRVAISEFPVTEVYSASRQVVEDKIETRLRESINRTYLIVDEVLLRDIRFSDAFAQAIENKQIAEQNAQRMQYVLERTEKEREQRIIEAEGEAEAIELKGQAVAENTKVIQYEYVQKIAPNIGTIIFERPELNRPRLVENLAVQSKCMGKIVSREELVKLRASWKEQGSTVVFTNGCYDLLHPGHIRLLEQARSLGDILILALNTDASVRRLKGPSRPLISEHDRAALASGLEAVDAVTYFDEDTPTELIAAVLPDILVKGADWSHWIAGREEVEAAGGKVMALPLEPGYSTTGIVEEILNRQP